MEYYRYEISIDLHPPVSDIKLVIDFTEEFRSNLPRDTWTPVPDINIFNPLVETSDKY